MTPRATSEKPLDAPDRICGKLEVYQSQTGYRFGMEALFLCGFVRSGADLGVDLGSGSGVIPLVLARFYQIKKMVGVEIQEAMVERARRSVERNGFQDRIEILHADLASLESLLPRDQFDLVASNPPHGRRGAGRVSIDQENAIARHEIRCHLQDVVSSAKRLLKPRGRFYVVFPPARLPEVLSLCQAQGLAPTRLRLIQGRVGLAPKNCLLEAQKGTRATLKIEPCLIIYDKEGSYTEEAHRMLYPEG